MAAPAAVVIESDDLDVATLDEARRATVLAAFAGLCGGLEMPLTITMHSRAFNETIEHPLTVTEGRSAARDALLDSRARHWLESSDRRGAFRRRINFVIRDQDADPATVAVTKRLVESTLEACGIGHRVLAHDVVGRLLSDCAGVAAAAHPGGVCAWSERITRALLGDELIVEGLVLSGFPGIGVDAGWLDPLLSAPADCDIAIAMRPVPVQQAMRVLARRLRAMESDHLLRAERGVLSDAQAEAGRGAAHDLRRRLASRRGRPIEVSVSAVARARTVSALREHHRTLRAAARWCMATTTPTHFRHMSTALSCWPATGPPPPIAKLVDSAAAATLIPWVHTNCDDQGGYRLGHSLDTRLPVSVAPFDSSVHSNANVVVLARSGQGKSYTVGTLVIEAALRGVESVVVDPEGEYGDLTRALGGDVLDLAPGGRASLNVLDVGGDPPGEAGLAAVQARVAGLFAILSPDPMPAGDRRAIDQAVATTLERARPAMPHPVLGDCLALLPPGAPARAVLGQLTRGGLASLFNRPTTLPERVGSVCLNLRDLDRELVAPAAYLVAEWLWSLIRGDRRRRHLVFDEVGLLYEHAALRRLLVQLARRCRKYDTSLLVATQNAGDLLRSADGTVVATNPSIALLGGHRGAELAAMEAAFGLSREHRRRLEVAGRGQFVLLAGNRRLSIAVEVPPEFHELLTHR